MTRIKATLKFHGDFSAVMNEGNSSAKAVALREASESTLSRLMGFPISIVSMYIGSRATSIEALVPLSDPGTANAVHSHIKNLGSVPSSGFG
jgi:hypothetical protein